MNIMIVGSRAIDDYEFVKTNVDEFLKDKSNEKQITIISGGARGIDSLAEKYAEEKGYEFKCFPANWGKFGRAAGPIRNRKMVNYIKKYGGVCLVFWNGKSTGSKEDIELCKKNRVECKVYKLK